MRKLRSIPGIKKIFIRSGIRYDYLLQDKNGEFFAELVKHHMSGQLKVAPEHCIGHVLEYMGKPRIAAYETFRKKYDRLNQKYGKNQHLVPYLMSSHPRSKLGDAVSMAEWLNRTGRQPEQVQDFYPTPGTVSTCMYYTGIEPHTMKPVYIPKRREEKEMQHALLQWKRSDKREIVLKALRRAGREDLIGYGAHCLIRPKPSGQKSKAKADKAEQAAKRKATTRQAKPGRKP